MRKLLLFLLILPIAGLHAQQVADNDYTTPAFAPKYKIGGGSVVVIDEAHNNFHTATGRYAPFAKVLTMDGYVIRRGQETFSDRSLAGVKILVIANALNEANTRKWVLPTPSAFSPAEIKAVVQWVTEGGSLFLIADHLPFGGAASDLARMFDVNFGNSFAVRKDTYGKPDVFYRSDKGFDPGELPGMEGVDSVATFMGQGFELPRDAHSIVNLDDRFTLYFPREAWKFVEGTPQVKGSGKSQGGYLTFGKGRVVVFGEAAMFSAQDANGVKAGMNAPQGANNYRLLLSLIHWLDGDAK